MDNEGFIPYSGDCGDVGMSQGEIDWIFLVNGFFKEPIGKNLNVKIDVLTTSFFDQYIQSEYSDGVPDGELQMSFSLN